MLPATFKVPLTVVLLDNVGTPDTFDDDTHVIGLFKMTNFGGLI